MIIYCIRHDLIKWNNVQTTIKNMKYIDNFEYILQELKYEPFNKEDSNHIEILRIHTQNPSVIVNHGSLWHFERNMPIENIAENKQYYIIYVNIMINSNHTMQVPCGIFCITEYDANSVYIAYTVDPIFQNCGIGTIMIELIIQHIQTQLSHIRIIRAKVWSDNYASQSILQKNGFILQTGNSQKLNESTNEFAEWYNILQTNSLNSKSFNDVRSFLLYTKKI